LGVQLLITFISNKTVQQLWWLLSKNICQSTTDHMHS
jgi:hypothetical protein